MKLFVLNPIKSVMSSDLIDRFSSISNDVIIDTEPKSILSIKGIDSIEEKVIALDPDFVDWKLESDIFKNIPNLKAIVLSCTDTSWIDLESAKKHNVLITNTKNFSSKAVANWGLTMMLNVSRKLPLLIKDDFKMDMERHSGIEVQGKSVGIVGLGNIGSEFAKVCDGIGMNVKYWSKNSRNSKYKYLELEDLFKTCDVIYPSLAKNSETKNLITDEMLKSMQKSSILIANTKSVYNHNLAISLAENNLIYGYGFENGSNENFKSFKGNIWAAPSMAWCTEECYLRNGELWLEEVLNVIKTFLSL